ncbi:TfuA-like protein [Aurantimonas sp. A2-1-M11]|uniref:TfuA-like protein n=1 Tax=Aurantimonas sp. A2-1-M11 TaxID=3113712 RepID=UPI002F91E5F0
MSVVLFAGPSLAGLERPLPPIFDRQPPARHGDVFRAAQLRPAAIALADGFFEGVLAVWHKEILWALSLGIPVFGAASMGALRAAELDTYGMVGVGRIYQDYQSGKLEADDEVALLHGPEEVGYLPLTEPLVNVRATVSAAQQAGILGPCTVQAVMHSAIALFYKARTWPNIMQGIATSEASASDVERFQAWLPAGRVDQKRKDALAMVALVAELCGRDALPRVNHDFEPTFLWDRALAGWNEESAPATRPSRSAWRGRETLASLLDDAVLNSPQRTGR